MGVGAGIVYDSDAADEYAECQLKARFLTGLDNQFEVFETMRASHDEGCRHRELHLARMAASARYFGFPFDARRRHAPRWTRPAPASSPAAAPAAPRARPVRPVHASRARRWRRCSEPVGLLLADDAIRADELFVRHKTSIRSRYDAAWRDGRAHGGFDTLFFNERGELTEGGRSNVFVRIDGRWITPPLSCGVLPGVMRAVLLERRHGMPAKASSRAPCWRTAEEIVVCNALRGPLRAYLA